MVLKKLLVGCLIAAVLIGGNGTVLAGSLENDTLIDNGISTVSGDEAGIKGSSAFPTIVVNGGSFHFYKGQVITAEDLLKKITVVDSSGKENAELKNSILFTNGAPLQRLSAKEEAAFINEMIDSYGYEDWEKNGLYVGIYVDGYNYKIADVLATRAYFDATAPSEVTGNVVYSTHVQNVGWQDAVADGDMSGTEGRSQRLEGIKINSGIAGVGIEYATHVQNIGWQNAVTDGIMSGTEGKGLRLEAIHMNLTGVNADQYDVVYRVHAQNVGWMGYAMNGDNAGTAGYGYRLEAIEIKIIKKGTFTGDTENAFKDSADDNRWKQLYLDKLKNIKTGDSSLDYKYFLYDMDSDGSSELVVKATKSTVGVGTCEVYKITDDKKNVQKLTSSEKILDGVAYVGGYRGFLLIPQDGNGLYVSSFYSTKPEVNMDRVNLSGNSLVQNDVTTLTMNSDEYKAFMATTNSVQWFAIDDTHPLS